MRYACIPLRSALSLGLACARLAAAEIHVSPAGNDTNPGTPGAMLKTISAAANLAQPGDTVTVHEGTYRERIDPPRGGTSDSNRIVYQAASGEAVTIKGSEIVSGWQFVGNDTWTVTLPAGFFGAFNPFNNLLAGDWFVSNGRNHHSGAVYLNGRWLAEAAAKSTVLQPASGTSQWFAEVNGGGPLMNVGWLQPYAATAAGTRVDASWFEKDFGVINASSSEGGQCVGFTEDGDWTRYKNVDFGNNADSLKFRAASAAAGGRIEVRLDGPTGMLLGICAVAGTGGWQSWQTFTATITPTSGTHDVCLVYRFPAANTGETTIWAQFPGKNPNMELVEVNTRQTVFYPGEPGRDFITVRGFTMEQAATPWSPPTAEQIGLIGTHWSKGWIIENNVVRYSVCAGISLGKYGDRYDNTAQSAEGYVGTINRALANGWNKATVGSHTVRGNRISNCEQVGIVGSLGCSFSKVTGNEVHDIHVRKLFGGDEQAGIKFHGALDAEISGNHVYRSGRFGLWLDWMAQGSKVDGNLFHDNPSADIYCEMQHGPMVVSNNILLSPTAVWFVSDGIAFAHNLVVGAFNCNPFDPRVTPYLLPHSTAIAGQHDAPPGDHRLYNNLYVGNLPLTLGGPVDNATLPCFAAGNVFTAGAQASSFDTAPLVLPSFNPGISLAAGSGGYYLTMTADPAWREARTRPFVTTALLGHALIPNLPYEQADGSPLSLDTDFLGVARNTANPFPGPFETVTDGINVWKVFDDPSVTAPVGPSATPGINRVVLHWTSFIGATSYSVKRATISGGPYTTVANGLTNTTWVDTGAIGGTPYFYAITASDGVNEGVPSAEITATPLDRIAINSGGGASGNFAADAMFSAGTVYTTGNAVNTTGVTNPAPSAVYQSERWGALNYTVPDLSPGSSYLVRLHFAEIYFNAPGGGAGGVGSRVFNVLVNGNAALSNFDVYAAAGGANMAVVREVAAMADSNGQITIALQTVVSNPKISGFEIIPLPEPQSPTGLTTTAGYQQVALNWSSASGAQGYRVWRSDSLNGTYSVIGTTTNPAFSDLNVTSGTTYYYAVSSTNLLGESANSASVSATPLMSVTPVWTNPAGGSWPVGGSWNNGVVANGSNVVADFGTLNLTADAAVTLDGARTLGGLVFGDASPSHNWALNTGSGGPLTLDAGYSPFIQVNNSSATLGVVLAGSKGLAKTGPGLLTLTATNTYMGGTSVDGGTLTVNTGGGAGSIRGALTINSGALVNASTSWSLGYNGDSTAVTTIAINGGTLNFTGALNNGGTSASSITMTGGVISGTGFDWYNGSAVTRTLTTIASSTTATLSGGINIRLGSTGVLKFDVADGAADVDLLISGVLRYNAGQPGAAVIKDGAGRAVFSAANTYTGTTTVTGGTLLINGTHSGNGAFNVAAGSILGGTGSIAAGVTAGGTLSPGVTGTGTLATGPVTLTGTYACQLDGPNCDRLSVSGGLTFTGATLAVSTITPPTAASYVIASYTGAVPAFTTVTGLPAGYSVDYATPGQIKLIGSPPYAGWAAPNGLNQTNGNKNQDPDQDGVVNLMEFALGGDPLGAADHGKSLAAIREVAGSPALTLTIAVRAGATFAPGSANTWEAAVDGITYRIEAGPDLSTWTEPVSEVIPAIISGLPSAPAGYEYHTFKTKGPVGSMPADFIRTRVEAP